MNKVVNIIGGGFAARESALTLAGLGVEVHLFDEIKFAPAEDDKQSKLLLQELRALGCESVLGEIDNLSLFGQNSIKKLVKNEKIKIFDKKVSEISLSEPTIVATGSQTTEALADQLESVFGKLNRLEEAKQILLKDNLKGIREGEFLFFPLTNEDVKNAYDYLKGLGRLGETIEGGVQGGFEAFKAKFFKKSIICGKIYDCALKFRLEKGKKVLLNFKTNLSEAEQKRLLEILHINCSFENKISQKCTFLSAFRQFEPTMQSKKHENIFFAGSILGIEGALAAVATGHLAGMNMFNYLHGRNLVNYPPESVCGKMIEKLFLQNGYKNDEIIKFCDIIGQTDEQKSIKKLKMFKEAFDARISWHNDMCSKKRW